MDADELRAVRQLHRDVDEAAARLVAAHQLECRLGCTDCCVDELSVFEVEAALIRSGHADLLAQGKPHPPGRCALLATDGQCRIYDSRPYVCRTQGLPLRWFGVGPEGQDVEYRDVCPINEEAGVDVVALPPERCWTIGPFEARLHALEQAQQPAGDPPRERVRLRDLFEPREPRR